MSFTSLGKLKYCKAHLKQIGRPLYYPMIICATLMAFVQLREQACGTFDPRLDELSKELCCLSSVLAQLWSNRSRGELQQQQGQ